MEYGKGKKPDIRQNMTGLGQGLDGLVSVRVVAVKKNSDMNGRILARNIYEKEVTGIDYVVGVIVFMTGVS